MSSNLSRCYCPKKILGVTTKDLSFGRQISTLQLATRWYSCPAKTCAFIKYKISKSLPFTIHLCLFDWIARKLLIMALTLSRMSRGSSAWSMKIMAARRTHFLRQLTWTATRSTKTPPNETTLNDHLTKAIPRDKNKSRSRNLMQKKMHRCH